jgi:alkyl hydroperoxide reductase subunit AhpC
LVGYEERRDAFAEQGVKIIAGVVDSQDETQAVAAELGFPVAFGMTASDGDAMGSWWDEKRQCIQPSEFILSTSGRVLISAYSNGPIGRMDPEETLNLVKYLNQQRKRGAGSAK